MESAKVNSPIPFPSISFSFRFENAKILDEAVVVIIRMER